MRRLLILFFCIPIGMQLFAQYDDDIELPEADPNLKKYLDDGMRQDAFGNVQVAITSFIPGWLDVSYEQKINRIFSAEAGVGVRLFSGPDLIDLLNDGGTGYLYEEVSLKSGFGYTAGLRYYPFRAGITQYGYYGLDVRGRNTAYSFIDNTDEGYNINTMDFIFSTGRKRIYENNVSLGLVTGFGARIYKYKFTESSREDINYGGFIYLLQLKLGYYL